MTKLNATLFLRSLLASCLLAAGLTSNATLEPPNHAVILMYHHVAEDTPAITSIRPQQFRQQMDYLQQNDYKIWSLDRVVKALQEKQPIPDKVVVITFDDAYLSVYQQAFPLLKKRQWPFTVFTSAEPIDRAYPSHSTWDQLREMRDHGALIANHSFSHAHLAARAKHQSLSEWRKQTRYEIMHNQQRLEQEIGQREKYFAYPYGEYTDALQQLILSLGYIGLGQHSGPVGEHSDFSALPRFPVGGIYTDMEQWTLKLDTLPMHIEIREAESNPLPFEQDTPRLQFTIQDPAILAKQIQCYAGGQKASTTVVDRKTVEVKSQQGLNVGRSRYNCTARADDGSFYWYSHPWIKLDKNGAWLKD